MSNYGIVFPHPNMDLLSLRREIKLKEIDIRKQTIQRNTLYCIIIYSKISYNDIKDYNITGRDNLIFCAIGLL